MKYLKRIHTTKDIKNFEPFSLILLTFDVLEYYLDFTFIKLYNESAFNKLSICVLKRMKKN